MLVKAIKLSFDSPDQDYSNTNRNILKKLDKDISNEPLLPDNNPLNNSDNNSLNTIQNDTVPYSGWLDWIYANRRSGSSKDIPYEHHYNAQWIEWIMYMSLVIIIIMVSVYVAYVAYSLESVKYIVLKIQETLSALWRAYYDTFLYLVSTKYTKTTEYK